MSFAAIGEKKNDLFDAKEAWVFITLHVYEKP